MKKHNPLKATLVVSAVTLALGCHAADVTNTNTTAAAAAESIPTKKASTFPSSVSNPQPGEIIVKCAGIAKKGANHCGANGHSCNGLSAENPDIKDFDKNEWVYVRQEVCDVTPGTVVGKKLVVEG